MALNTRIQTRRDTAANWESKNPVLLDGELIIVSTNAGDTRFKIGDGVKTYTQLPFQDETLYNALSGKADSAELDAKQDILVGAPGKIVGFDENGNAVAQDAVSGSGGIIDVYELPTDNINNTALYRLFVGQFVHNRFEPNGWKVIFVDGLPEVGEPVSTDMASVTAYYSSQNNDVYAYVDDMVSAATGVSVGWYLFTDFALAIGIPFNGVISDIDDDPCDDSLRLLLTYKFYMYQDCWCNVAVAYEKPPKIDITWDGVIGDRFALDVSSLGFENTYFVKVSDDVFTADQLVGFKCAMNDGYSNESIAENSLDTTTYPGAIDVDHTAVIVYASDSLNSALGLPTGYITDGTYFVYIDNGDSKEYTNRLASQSRIVKLDSKFVDVTVPYVTAGQQEGTTIGDRATAEGFNTNAQGTYSHAEGVGSHAAGDVSHAEGVNSHADGYASHAEGQATTATGTNSHAEGQATTATGTNSHAEGESTTATGEASHAEGDHTNAQGLYSHAEGKSSRAGGYASHAEGYSSNAEGEASHAEGNGSFASGNCSHAEGNASIAKGNYSHAEGHTSHANGNYSHAEGYASYAEAAASHAEGYMSHAEGEQSHAEGRDTIATGDNSHAEGYASHAEGDHSHAEGQETTAPGKNSHAEGYMSHAEGENSHAEGESTTATGTNSHAEGESTTATGTNSHAEGDHTNAQGLYSHAEGNYSHAAGDVSHAEGQSTIADGNYSHAEGFGSHAVGLAQHVQGRYNRADPEYDATSPTHTCKYAHIVGNGNSLKRSNAHVLDWDGNAWFAGDVYVGSTFGVDMDAGSKKLVTEDELASKFMQMTLLATGWTNDSGDTNYPYQHVLTVDGVTSASRADAVLDSGSVVVASSCGVCAVSETIANAVIFKSRTAPAVDLTGVLYIIRTATMSDA